MDTRKFARRAKGSVFVFSGPLFAGTPKTIGSNRVWVPTHLYKLVYDEASGRSWAHIVENNAAARLGEPMDYGTFVRQAGWQLLGSNLGRAAAAR
jgi:endonuclease G